MATKDNIVTALKTAIPDLNTSSTSIIGAIVDPVSVATDAALLEVNRTPIVINKILQNQKYTTPQHYINILLAWQEGDELKLIDPIMMTRAYEVINPAKQNCKQAFMNMDTAEIYVNTIDADGMLTLMTDAQLEDISSYFEFYRSVGFSFLVLSHKPAILRADKLVIRFARSYSRTQVIANVQAKMKEFQVTPHFTSEVLINTIESTIRETDGVQDAYLANPYIEVPHTYDSGSDIFNFVDGSVVIPTVAVNFWPDAFTANPLTFEMIPV